MDKSTYRIINSMGLLLIVVLLGVLIFVLAKAVELTPSNPKDSEIKLAEISQQKKIGFDYSRNSDETH